MLLSAHLLHDIAHVPVMVDVIRELTNAGGESFMGQENPFLLVVDDDFESRDLLSRRLKIKGYKVAVAEGGRAAMELMKSQRFDLLLLDIMMPEISGLECLRALRRRFSSSELPIIMVTARNDTESIVNALNMGANDYVTKPIDFPVVLARVQAQLLRKEVEENLRSAKKELETRVVEQTKSLEQTNEQLRSELNERRRIVEELCLSEARFRTTFEDAPIGMVITSEDGTLVKVNKTLCEMLGYGEEELIGKTLLDIIHPEERQDINSLHYDLLHGKLTTTQVDRCLITKCLEPLRTCLTVTAIPYQSGKDLFGFIMIETVTDRKRDGSDTE